MGHSRDDMASVYRERIGDIIYGLLWSMCERG